MKRHMEVARLIAAECWCDDETKDIEMDSRLAEAIAVRLAVWMETCAHFASGMEYYRGLVERCGQAIGEEAYTQDDGGKVDSVLCDKVPELVEALVDRCKQ